MINTNESVRFADKAEQVLRKILAKYQELLDDELLHEISETLSVIVHEMEKEEVVGIWPIVERKLENKRLNTINEFRHLEESLLKEMLQKYKDLLSVEIICKIYEALNLRTKEKQEEKSEKELFI